jgi:uncharacterized membrane protein
MAHDDFCPACNKVLAFEEYEGDLFCSSCGRTKNAARMAVKAEVSARKQKTINKWTKRGKYVIYAIGLALLGLYFIFFIFFGGWRTPLGGRVLGWIVICTVIFGISGVILAVRLIVARFFKKR